MVSPLTHQARLLAAALRDGDEGVDRVAERVRDAAGRRPGGTFDKGSALYLPVSPIPTAFWRQECGRCRFWHEGEPGTPGGCHVVGRPGDRFGGEAIHPHGWCAYFTPPAGEPPLAWLRERLHPTGATSVRGEYRTTLGERGVDSASRRREREVPVTEEGHAGREPDGGALGVGATGDDASGPSASEERDASGGRDG